MLKLRTDIAYVGQMGKFTQAGVEAIQGQLDDKAANADVAALDVRADALEAVANENTGGAAPFYGCRAWVDFNGTGTPAIRASGNVSSITDNGVGDYTVNFTNAMPDADYAVVGSGRFDTTDVNAGHPTVGIRRATGAKTTTSVRITVTNPASGAGFDADIITVAVFR